jgi:glycolate oxidase FAD binding subunit
MTPQSVWGNIGPQLELMQAVKRQFDPHGILNPGRFVV